MTTITTELDKGYTTRIKVYEHSDDFLTAKCWCFFYDKHKLRLDWYHLLSRTTKRHKYKAVERWERLDRRGSNISRPELPDLVRWAASEKFSETLEVES